LIDLFLHEELIVATGADLGKLFGPLGLNLFAKRSRRDPGKTSKTGPEMALARDRDFVRSQLAFEMPVFYLPAENDGRAQVQNDAMSVPGRHALAV
jgi:hypothetical protein